MKLISIILSNGLPALFLGIILATAGTAASSGEGGKEQERLLTAAEERPRRPNILFILADDLGYNDVSWHNKDMQTPNLEKLAREGVILEQAYTQQVCTPSRAALLTGKYPFHIGRQKRALKPLQPTGLSVNLTTLPDQLSLLGYQNHMVGKWHLGYCANEYTPTRRGFHTFLGFYLGTSNYFTHDREYKRKEDDPPTFKDFRLNEELVADDYQDIYSTTIFRDRTKAILRSVRNSRELNAYKNYDPFFIYLSFQATHAPLQARAKMLKKVSQTNNPARDIYKAMLLDMDTAIGDIVSKLKEFGLYNETIIVFTTDNGGAISHGASNHPLRGTKGTMFEGGTRGVSFVHAPGRLDKNGYVNNRLIHITDWMPTLLKQAGYKGDPSEDLGLDGVDQWASLSEDKADSREEMVYNLRVGPVAGAIRVGDYKLLFGKKFNKQGWYDVKDTVLQCSRLFKNKKLKRKMQAELDDSDLERKGSRKKDKNIRKHKNRDKKKHKKNKNKKHNKKNKKHKKNNKNTNKKKEGNRRKKNKGKRQQRRLSASKRERLDRKQERRNNMVDKREKRVDNADKKGKGMADKKERKSERRRKMKEAEARREERERLREEKRKARDEQKKREKQEKKLVKIWKDWVPQPKPAIENVIRLRMQDCNWVDFEGHNENHTLIPRQRADTSEIVDLYTAGADDIVSIVGAAPNPFNITAEDEDNEFQEEDMTTGFRDMSLEAAFDSVDVALYNLREDPQERNDLKLDHPEIFKKLRSRVLYHLANISPEDFPPQDLSGHPRNFEGAFSSGWCSPK